MRLAARCSQKLLVSISYVPFRAAGYAKSDHPSPPGCLLLADSVAKVFLRHGSQILRGVGAAIEQRCGGPRRHTPNSQAMVCGPIERRLSLVSFFGGNLAAAAFGTFATLSAPSGHADPSAWCLLPGVDQTWRSKPPLPPIDRSLKFSNLAGRAGVRKLLARNKSRTS
jgi:hypothetical protein